MYNYYNYPINFINQVNRGNIPPLGATENKLILSQLEKCICNIEKLDGIKGTGFLCKIPYPDQFKLLPVLITNNHILNRDDIEVNKTIKIIIDNKVKYIKLGERKAYSNAKENIDITIIEIIPNLDGLLYFLDVDEMIFDINYKQIFQNKLVYLLQYSRGKPSHSEGIITNIYNGYIEHTCSNNDYESSGAPILNLSTFKVIGVLKNKNQYISNIGIFMKYIIDEFNKTLLFGNHYTYKEKKNNNIQNNVNNNDQLNINNNLPGNQNQFNNNNNQNNNNSIIPNNTTNNNEITNDNNLKDYYRKCNGNIVNNYSYYEYNNKNNKDYINFKIIENISGDPNKILFCLFNGHGGAEVSKYLQENIALEMKNILPLKEVSKDFTKLFILLDEKIKLLNVPNVGATGTIAYIESFNGKRILHCSNVGNNKCILVNKRGLWRITNEHNINDPKEHKRIILKGGILNVGKMFGKLKSSRTFGDWSIKQYGGLICEPHISVTDLKEDDLYLIIASEKVWHFIKDEELLKLSEVYKNSSEICKKIVHLVLKKGCKYNIGSIVVNLQ